MSRNMLFMLAVLLIGSFAHGSRVLRRADRSLQLALGSELFLREKDPSNSTSETAACQIEVNGECQDIVISSEALFDGEASVA